MVLISFSLITNYSFRMFRSFVSPLREMDFFFFFLGPHPQHVKVPRVEVKLELQLLAYATAIATLDLSCICDLQGSLQQHQILNPLREASHRTHTLTDIMQGF